ncbi:hypothetical protein [Rhodococcus sp. UFZ-B548]|uniref:hypothetical protein n=1 Tax=Rhodococcus sp. UFZ-B548 TaxID=2742212 RepID=UPI0015F43F4D|nr:hypothetical protein [Rhodococcus sp. UFZ-B548]
MATWKTRAAVGLGTMGLVLGALNTLAPQSPDTDERDRTRIERDLGDLSDSDERARDRVYDNGSDGLNDENRERLRPVEPRPGELPKVRIRLP